MLRRLLLALVPTLVVATAGAATYTVTRTNDIADVTPGDGYCGAVLGICTLRAAIQEANAQHGRDTIILSAGTYTLTLAGQDEDEGATGDLDVRDSLEIIGAGASVTVINGSELDRVLDLDSDSPHPVEIVLQGVTITRGAAVTSTTQFGGGIVIRPHTVLRMSHCRVTANIAHTGGGIFLLGADAEADIRYSTLDANSTVVGMGNQQGAAIADSDDLGERLSLRYSTVSGNATAVPDRHAIDLQHAASVSVTGSTIADNIGGGLNFYNADVTIAHSTIADNDGMGLRFGSYDGSHALTMINTIIGGLPTCSLSNALLYTHAGNLESAQNCGLDTSAGELEWTDPELGPLADNGGPTMTRAPNPGSPAIDVAAAATHCASPDQRGVSRPQDGDGDGVAACDIGAVEVADLVFVDTFESGDTSFWSAVAP